MFFSLIIVSIVATTLALVHETKNSFLNFFGEAGKYKKKNINNILEWIETHSNSTMKSVSSGTKGYLMDHFILDPSCSGTVNKISGYLTTVCIDNHDSGAGSYMMEYDSSAHAYTMKEWFSSDNCSGEPDSTSTSTLPTSGCSCPSENYDCWGAPTFDTSASPWTSLGSGAIGKIFSNKDCSGDIVSFHANKLHECLGTMTVDSCSGSSAGYSEYTDLTYCEPPATSQGSTGLGICGLYGTANVVECF